MRKVSLLLLTLGLSAGCPDGCRNAIAASHEAPGGRHRAVLFQRDCGATTGFSTQISVVGGGKPLVGGGSLFIADLGHGAVPPAP